MDYGTFMEHSKVLGNILGENMGAVKDLFDAYVDTAGIEFALRSGDYIAMAIIQDYPGIRAALDLAVPALHPAVAKALNQLDKSAIQIVIEYVVESVVQAIANIPYIKPVAYGAVGLLAIKASLPYVAPTISALKSSASLVRSGAKMAASGVRNAMEQIGVSWNKFRIRYLTYRLIQKEDDKQYVASVLHNLEANGETDNVAYQFAMRSLHPSLESKLSGSSKSSSSSLSSSSMTRRKMKKGEEGEEAKIDSDILIYHPSVSAPPLPSYTNNIPNDNVKLQLKIPQEDKTLSSKGSKKRGRPSSKLNKKSTSSYTSLRKKSAFDLSRRSAAPIMIGGFTPLTR